MFEKPLQFVPYYKSVIWGGDRIAKYKNEVINQENVGESWEISAVPGHESVVADGEYKGKKLTDLVNEYGADFLGTEVFKRCGKEFPLLIKIIDARQDLSVQVHPDDELARKRHDSAGKTEMWYIIDREPGSKIYTGLKAPLNPEEYKRRIADNSIMEVVGDHVSEPNQFYFVPAGTIHAIGAGNLLAEVQQTSDITYRVYDYDRRDAEGNPRELHTELATDAIDYRFPNDITPTATVYPATTMKAVTSAYFTTDFLHLIPGEKFDVDTIGKTFAIIIVSKGTLDITLNSGEILHYKKGDTLLIPASMPPCTLSGDCNALFVNC